MTSKIRGTMSGQVLTIDGHGSTYPRDHNDPRRASYHLTINHNPRDTGYDLPDLPDLRDITNMRLYNYIQNQIRERVGSLILYRLTPDLGNIIRIQVNTLLDNLVFNGTLRNYSVSIITRLPSGEINISFSIMPSMTLMPINFSLVLRG